MKLLRYALVSLLSAAVGVFAAFLFQTRHRAAPVHIPAVKSSSTEISGSVITEITLRRTTCYGSCPDYEVTLRSDGTASYIGRDYAERVGKYEGFISSGDFIRLAEFLNKRNYFVLKDRYHGSMTDVPAAITSAVVNGERKTVVTGGYACQACAYSKPIEEKPLALWQLETAIDGVAATIDWERAK